MPDKVISHVMKAFLRTPNNSSYIPNSSTSTYSYAEIAIPWEDFLSTKLLFFN